LTAFWVLSTRSITQRRHINRAVKSKEKEGKKNWERKEDGNSSLEKKIKEYVAQ
jgi:hypothetical protein